MSNNNPSGKEKLPSKISRSTREMWPVGSAIEKLPEHKLPTIKQVICMYSYEHMIKNQRSSRIPTMSKSNAISKLKRIVLTYNKLKQFKDLDTKKK
ncbi:hypothetical protein A3Q56_07654 [Intoshia linei]|uniref:Uncharacterized protein n=1 Tax=Intoshia linei TaxID=1819745 RepID=A0A177AS20_9BILA|nr:hypothetical protein A3Q56_07654 [Intoshia linei]